MVLLNLQRRRLLADSLKSTINEKEAKVVFPTKKVQTLIGSKIRVEMKGSERHVLEGTLNSVDDYLNLHLLETVEIVDGERARSLGSVILRGNNIILISPVE